jgi:hypothetical protein
MTGAPSTITLEAGRITATVDFVLHDDAAVPVLVLTDGRSA